MDVVEIIEENAGHRLHAQVFVRADFIALSRVFSGWKVLQRTR